MEKLSASLEDYLESIFLIEKEKGAARPKDIADCMSVTAASVTGALKLLAEKELVNYAPYDIVTLTDSGRQVAETVSRKHKVLLRFFTDVLDIPKIEVEEFACKMEHIIPDHVLERFVEFADFVDHCPNRGAIWREGARGYFCSKNNDPENTLCDKCHLSPSN